MPIYEYECTECGHRTELLQRHGDPPLESCSECGSPVRKLFSAPAVQFKGSGWYVTDYAGKGKSATPSSTPAKSESASSDAGSGDGKKESKPAAGSSAAKGGGDD